jgi:acetyltransferase-like isoleucine patch superfamily enzyme
MSAGTFAFRLRKKLLKRLSARAFFPAMRPRYLRWCGFSVGSDVYIGDGLTIIEELADRGMLTIGDRVSIATNVTLVTSSHPNASRIRGVAPVQRGPVVLEDDAWIGAGVVVLPGVRIGRGAVVGALSVVTRDVAPLHVVAGSPASVVRELPPPDGWA